MWTELNLPFLDIEHSNLLQLKVEEGSTDAYYQAWEDIKAWLDTLEPTC